MLQIKFNFFFKGLINLSWIIVNDLGFFPI